MAAVSGTGTPIGVGTGCCGCGGCGCETAGVTGWTFTVSGLDARFNNTDICATDLNGGGVPFPGGLDGTHPATGDACSMTGSVSVDYNCGGYWATHSPTGCGANASLAVSYGRTATTETISINFSYGSVYGTYCIQSGNAAVGPVTRPRAAGHCCDPITVTLTDPTAGSDVTATVTFAPVCGAPFTASSSPHGTYRTDAPTPIGYTVTDPPPCRHRPDDPVPSADAAAAGLDVRRDWFRCGRLPLPLGLVTGDASQGLATDCRSCDIRVGRRCGPTCGGYDPGEGEG